MQWECLAQCLLSINNALHVEKQIIIVRELLRYAFGCIFGFAQQRRFCMLHHIQILIFGSEDVVEAQTYISVTFDKQVAI